ncbi:DNA-directed RNA polymerase subunit delta [Alkalihalophilus marmarensis]|uniref:DNA-directed RNA polymerase subunit delta n=1 Tax=Alkalihalophilus marmarensis TaxID=521377 RepID=UPI00399D1926
MLTLNLREMEKEEIQELSMVEVAYALMKEKRQPYYFTDLVKEISEIKGMKKAEVNQRMSFLYTDLNIDGRFLTLGDNNWGLKSWYPHEQSEEEITSPVNPRKKAKSDDEDLDDDLEVFDDEFEDLEDELDEISNEEDADDDDEEDADFTDKEDLDTDFDDDEEVEEDEER